MENSHLKNDPIIFDDRICGLGEGPLWHPLRQTLYWVDIPNRAVMSKNSQCDSIINFDEMVSALGWIDADHLMLATETGLYKMHVDGGPRQIICPVEADTPTNRSNDGRTDPWGGFWIGTMGKSAEAGAGSIYRWYKGELRIVTKNMTVTNGICFDRPRQRAYFVDSARQIMFFVMLNSDGWPVGEPKIFMDLSEENQTIDGAITDLDGNIWAAMWEDGEVAQFSPEGKRLSTLKTFAPRTTCPAFGGPDGTDLYVTTASVGLKKTPALHVPHGATLLFKNVVKGALEPRILLHD
ncbi:hypothetical protein LPB140_03520 [Sphingorhabdus lutea]|uniref:SMP-30/Gluconolactonase/LRE-like region domain-containing protein n=1 Tax=Sphingorhabdus lutea TaxID=1913578 RepID=A0A1L3JA74_9SPHN|nr:SMP-30/gluconolactonase/LRE family protein [Sphingorhabdus lutea]APG62036.1 hypothetical protein LPB140_03520 [Sphingorhabdus lutea]